MNNKNVRERLIKLYGNECFIEKLHLRKDIKPRKYKSKGQMKRMKQLTYHHILERRKGGKATVENGALLSAENHIWFHRQNKVQQGYMNAIFQEYKKQSDELKVVFVDDLELPYSIKAMEFKVSERKKEKYERAKKKQEDKKLIEDYMEEER